MILKSPYSAFADVYAETMADIPYDDWFRFIIKYLPAQLWKPIADLFSGPGKLAASALTAGYYSIAVDNNISFLKKGAGQRICADAVHLPFSNNALAALCAGNCSINYLPNLVTLEKHFQETRRVLDLKGVYIFDICPCERALDLTARTFHALGGKVSFTHSYESASQQLTTTVQLKQDVVHTERHIQRIFSDTEIASAAAKANFSVKVVIANYGLPVKNNIIPIMTWVLTPLNPP